MNHIVCIIKRRKINFSLLHARQSGLEFVQVGIVDLLKFWNEVLRKQKLNINQQA